MVDRLDGHENYYRHPLLGPSCPAGSNLRDSVYRAALPRRTVRISLRRHSLWTLARSLLRHLPRYSLCPETHHPRVVVSAVAWPIAYFGSFFAAGHIPGGIGHQGDAIVPAFPLIALGGALGGVALLIPVNLLLKPSSVKWGAAFDKVLLGILLSAFVGVIAWDLGPTLGAAIWALLPTAPLPQPESYAMAALFFVWQPVIALFIGWVTSEK